MFWLEFIISAGLIVFAATQLAKYGDVIAIRTKLGGMFIGVILLAGATSLPEVLTTINSFSLGVPNLAAGNLLGSNMFNMLMLAILDIVGRSHRVLRKVALRHALSGSLCIFLIGLVIFFILADIHVQIGWVGIDSLIIMLVYFWAVRLIQKNMGTAPIRDIEIPAGYPSLKHGILGFLLATVGLIIVTPILVRSSTDIAEATQLGTTFIGTTLVAIVTSLPEVVTTLAALKIGADDMAVGNLFGSNMFNVFAMGLADVFYLPGRFLGVIDYSFLLIGMLGLIMTGMGLIGNLAKIERRIGFLEIDAFALIIIYIAGMVLLYLKGVTL